MPVPPLDKTWGLLIRPKGSNCVQCLVAHCHTDDEICIVVIDADAKFEVEVVAGGSNGSDDSTAEQQASILLQSVSSFILHFL